MKKGIFCLEGNWEKDLRKKSTVEPILKLLECSETIHYIHRSCATVSELQFYLKEWQKVKYKNYQILYLAFHGKKNAIILNKEDYSLDKIADDLKGNCSDAVIIFSSCSVLKQDKRYLRHFLDKTKAYAVFGYRTDVDWMRSVAFELLLLSDMHSNVFDGRADRAFTEKINSLSKRFKDLEFRFIFR